MADVHDHLNSQTAKIRWRELQRLFASGRTVYVSPELDLIDVASAFQKDLANQVEAWLEQSLLAPVQTPQAKQWFEQDTVLWAVVVKPWVLVQLNSKQDGEP